MKIESLYIFVFVIVLCSCGKGSSRVKEDSVVPYDSTIVFFDIGEGSREDISIAIDRLDALGPRVLGVYSIFTSWNGSHEDSLLVFSLYNAKKIILVSFISDDRSTYEKSHRYFTGPATGVGVSSFLEHESGIVNAFIPLVGIATEGQMLSFPELIAYNYSDEASKKFHTLSQNEVKEIELIKNLNEFLVLDYNHLNRETVEGKIVILGEFKKSLEDLFFMETKEGQLVEVPGIVVEANIILNRLFKQGDGRQIKNRAITGSNY